MNTQTKLMPARIKTLGARTFETVITTGAVDREGDIIAADGWKLDNYMRGGAGVVLWAHDYSLPPIAKAISITRTATGLKSVDVFPPIGVYPFADTVHDLVAAGMINAKSVGFLPITKMWNATRNGWDISEAELLEHSYVSVPANPEALVVARSKGLDHARLAAFLGSATRDLGSVLELADDGPVLVDPTAIRTAFRQIVEDAVHGSIASAPMLAAPGDEGEVLLLIEGAASPGREYVALAADDVRAAWSDAMRDVVNAEVAGEVRRLRGRVD